MTNVADMAGACPDAPPITNVGLATPSLPWFALRVREKMREIAEAHMAPLVADIFSPKISEVRQWSDRRKVMQVPVFPGYLFAQFELDKRVNVLKVLGVMDMVRVGARPAEVDRDEIAALRLAYLAAVPLEALPHLVCGQRVRVTGGPMRGVEGTLALVKSQMKLVLAVTMMNRSVAVEIDQNYVLPVETPGASS